MPRVSAAFFLSGALFLLAGVLLGGHMGKTNDYALLTVHTHLNLVGWVTMALFSTWAVSASRLRSCGVAALA